MYFETCPDKYAHGIVIFAITKSKRKILNRRLPEMIFCLDRRYLFGKKCCMVYGQKG